LRGAPGGYGLSDLRKRFWNLYYYTRNLSDSGSPAITLPTLSMFIYASNGEWLYIASVRFSAADLLCNPRLLVLDEPYANIDVDTRFVIDAVLEEVAKGRTLLMTTHIRPGLRSFRLLTIIDGVISGEAVYRGDYVELKLRCGEGELTVELRAESEDLGEQLDKLNRLLREEPCTITGVRLETFDKLLQRIIQ